MENMDKKWRSFKIEPFRTEDTVDEQMEKNEELQEQAKNTSQKVKEAREEWMRAGEKTKEELHELKKLSDNVDMALGYSLALIAIAVIVVLVVLCKTWKTICY